jgi:hypothetical protein
MLAAVCALEADIRRWVRSLDSVDPAGLPLGIGTPETLQGLLDLTLSGRADQARAVLFDAGSAAAGPTFSAETFCDDVCIVLTHHPLWKRFELDRLPNAGLVEARARLGKSGRYERDYLADK